MGVVISTLVAASTLGLDSPYFAKSLSYEKRQRSGEAHWERTGGLRSKMFPDAWLMWEPAVFVPILSILRNREKDPSPPPPLNPRPRLPEIQ